MFEEYVCFNSIRSKVLLGLPLDFAEQEHWEKFNKQLGRVIYEEMTCDQFYAVIRYAEKTADYPAFLEKIKQNAEEMRRTPRIKKLLAYAATSIKKVAAWLTNAALKS